jgi:phage terminase large subunit-like protein
MASRKKPSRTTELNFDDVVESPTAPTLDEELWKLPLMEWIDAVGETFNAPTHLAPIIDMIERAERREGDLRGVCDAPVQHGKTSCLEWGIAWILLRHPERAVIYLTYDVRKAEKHSRRIRSLYTKFGGQIKPDFNTIHQWETTAGGGLLATSRDGDITGNPASHVFLDDGYKNAQEAEDADTRERLESKFADEIMTRMAPSGSIIIVASRWVEEDLSGKKIAEGYEHVHLEAITVREDGEEVALCPWGPDKQAPRTLEWLRGVRQALLDAGRESTWWSLYQGRPMPKGSGLFTDATMTESLPDMVRHAWGVDLAFSAGSKGDRTAVVLLGLGSDGVVYVLTVWSARMGVVEAAPTMLGLFSTRPEAPIAAYAAGPEVGSYASLAVDRPPILVEVMGARYNKYVRAKRTAARWSQGRIRVPTGRPWGPAFVRCVKGFTGADGGQDDEVDAFVAAHDRLMLGADGAHSDTPWTAGKRRM